MKNSALFISTLNEIEALNAIFDQIDVRAFDEIFALDGGSTDGTIEFFLKHNITVVHNVKKGEIFNVGAMLTKCENIVWFAPDGNEDPKDIVPLMKIIRDDNYDMAIGRRMGPGARNEEDDQVIKLRKWVNQIFSIFVHLRWGGGLYDSINGFRAVKRCRIYEMNPVPTGYDIEFQLTIRGLKLGYKIKEIPTYEGNRLGGESNAYPFSTGFLMLKRLFKELFNGIPTPCRGRLLSQADMDKLKIDNPNKTKITTQSSRQPA